MVDLLKLEHVSKSFESLLAVNEVSLSVEPGQVVGLIGPNGSGKSTLLSLIAGTLSADKGRTESSNFHGGRRDSSLDKHCFSNQQTPQRLRPAGRRRGKLRL